MTPYAQQQMVRMETQALFPYLIEITTPDGNIYRYANSDNDITFENHVFSACFFKLTPPERTDEGIKDAKITISSIDQLWIERIRQYKDRATIRFIAVIQYTNGNNVESIEDIDDLEFKLTKATWNESTIQWTMKFDDWMDIMFPCTKLTAQVCPALF